MLTATLQISFFFFFLWDSPLILYVQSNACRVDPNADWTVYYIATVMQILLGFYVIMEIFS